MLRELIKHLFKKPATVRYPFEKTAPVQGFRGKPVWDMKLCVGCGLCSRDCPTGAITMMGKGSTATFKYYLDRCLFCGQCAEICPVSAITMTVEYELVSGNRSRMIIYYAKTIPLIPIENIKGMGPTYAKQLTDGGIKTTNDLLDAGATKKGRRALATKTRISINLILAWVHLADLLRIRGVDEEDSVLLEAAGVDAVVKLSQRNPEHLHAKIVDVNEKKNLSRKPPTLEEVREWIEHAKKLPRTVEY